ncbi:putative DUF21 domain-containing protein, partial [Cardiosporidium cionae]
VNEVMQPRVNVIAIDRTRKISDLIRLGDETRCSRIPVYDEDIDEIVGIVKMKDVMKYLNWPELMNTLTVSGILEDRRDKPYFVHETMAAWDVLQEMRKRRLHMGIVVDEHGGTAGIVTLEDILEEVVGDIYDETDEEDLFEEDSLILWNSTGVCYDISGSADLQSVRHTLEIPIEEEAIESYTTISGFLCDEAGRIPKSGDYLIIPGYAFKVMEADEKRILKMKAFKLNSTPSFSASTVA